MVKTRHRFFAVFLVGMLSIIGIATYKAYTELYNHIMEKSEALHLKVEEVSGAHLMQLRITIDPLGSAPIIRSVSVQTHGTEMTILYHLALAGLAKPMLYWGRAYALTVPDSVKEVRFGRSEEVIWRRPNAAK